MSGTLPATGPVAAGGTGPLGPGAPDDELDAPIAPASEWARRTARAAAWLHGVPLRFRFVAITVVLLLVGLTIVGVTALTLLQRSLTGQVDDKLTSAAREVAEQATRSTIGGSSEQSHGAPTDYCVLVANADGTQLSSMCLNQSRTTAADVPAIPAFTIAEVQRLTKPFTVASAAGAGRWRVIAGAFVDGSGSVYVALPLGPADATMAQMRWVLFGISAAVVLLGATAGYVAVRRSLRPLREIEATAAAIAAGDLTRRVPAAPESTEVGRLGVALNGMLAQIEQAFEARTASEARMRRFVADASHELRTPLAAIRGYGELYRMGALTEDEQLTDTMRRIESSATRMGGLVEDLLALARLDEGRPMRVDHVDLAVLAADSMSDLHALDRDRPLRMVPLHDGGTVGPVVVLGDEARLRQVLANLVGNVVQHTPPGTAVEVALGRADDAWGVLEVRDHGPGISPEHAARVFERFYRVDASRTRDSGGAGLGMAIVAAIVGAHHGHVELLATPGGGTTVQVRLPLLPPPPAP